MLSSNTAGMNLPMCSDIAISVKNLSKTYRIFGHPTDRIKQMLTLGHVRFHREFTALKDVSFEIKKGETVGIIGRNGSGKSTLLQLICGILKPTAGEVKVNGRISALLELGSGFNPEFTGRENVYFQGAVMGIAKEKMDARFDEIVAFADIGEFIDQPVRTYSSGMYVRLAFATAIHSDEDILVVDEALSVGDFAFQAKCLRKISTLKQEGVTVILVTHNTEQVVSHCDRCLLLNGGTLTLDDSAKKCVLSYKQLLTSQDFAHPSVKIAAQESEGTGEAQFLEIVMHTENGEAAKTFWRNTVFTIQARLQFFNELHAPLVFFNISNAKGEILCGTSSFAHKINLGNPATNSVLNIAFQQTMLLNAGEYFLSMGCQTLTSNGYLSHDLRWECATFNVISDSPRPGVFDPQSSILWTMEERTPSTSE
jgi:ABC-type polysaccharide/polyol phosphate transport system ATPase subunit